MSRVLGNGHALVLRGARHSNVSGLPVRCDGLGVRGLSHLVRAERFWRELRVRDEQKARAAPHIARLPTEREYSLDEVRRAAAERHMRSPRGASRAALS